MEIRNEMELDQFLRSLIRKAGPHALGRLVGSPEEPGDRPASSKAHEEKQVPARTPPALSAQRSAEPLGARISSGIASLTVGGEEGDGGGRLEPGRLRAGGLEPGRGYQEAWNLEGSNQEDSEFEDAERFRARRRRHGAEKVISRSRRRRSGDGHAAARSRRRPRSGRPG